MKKKKKLLAQNQAAQTYLCSLYFDVEKEMNYQEMLITAVLVLLIMWG